MTERKLRIPETVRVAQGDSFVTINKSDFVLGVHELYEGSVSVDVPAPVAEPSGQDNLEPVEGDQPSESTNVEPKQATQSPSIVSEDLTVDELRFMIQGADLAELNRLRGVEDSREKPRKGAYAVIDEAIEKLAPKE